MERHKCSFTFLIASQCVLSSTFLSPFLHLSSAFFHLVPPLSARLHQELQDAHTSFEVLEQQKARAEETVLKLKDAVQESVLRGSTKCGGWCRPHTGASMLLGGIFSADMLPMLMYSTDMLSQC